MRILHVHNYYRQPGGEDESFAATGSMLEQCRHEVIRFTMHNETISGAGKLITAQRAVWNHAVYNEMRGLIRETRPDIAHFENTFPLVSPAAYYACRAEGVAVVQSLRNYRLVCPSATLYRDGTPCEDCLTKRIPWPSIIHRCYRGSLLGSAAVATMLTTHRALRTWDKQVDAYVALNSFARAKLIEAGLDGSNIHISPNFLSFNPACGDGQGDYALFAGRLTVEKGVRTLLAAWEELAPDLRLKILGDGPEADRVAEATARHPEIEWLGYVPPHEIFALAGQAKFMIVPSEWYEGFCRTILEAFATGTPVVGSDLGSMPAIIDHGRTGLLFAPNDPADLARQVRRLLGAPDTYAQMRAAAREEFEKHYTIEAGHARLMQIYDAARQRMERQALR